MSEKTNPLRLAELLSARMSHDLGGVIGTIAAALDMAVEETPDPGAALTLAAEAADELRARLRLVRAAWGPSDTMSTLAELRALSAGLNDGSRLNIDFVLPEETVFPPAVARLVLNVLMLAQEALPAGGLVTLAGDPDDLVVSIAGPRAAWPAGLASCLAGEANAWAAVQDPRTLQAPLTVLLARMLGLRLSLLMPASSSRLLPMLRLSKS